jgi:hypothetical protein
VAFFCGGGVSLRRGDVRSVLGRLSVFDSRYGMLGLHVFVERGLSWFDDHRLLIRGDVVDSGRFEEFEGLLSSLGLRWSLRQRGEEVFLVVHSMPLWYSHTLSHVK